MSDTTLNYDHPFNCRCRACRERPPSKETAMSEPSEVEVEAATRAMLNSKAWPAVFRTGTAFLLARIALAAAARVREQKGE